MLVGQDDVFNIVENNGCALLDIQQNFFNFHFGIIFFRGWLNNPHFCLYVMHRGLTNICPYFCINKIQKMHKQRECEKHIIANLQL